jgi:phage-related protein
MSDTFGGANDEMMAGATGGFKRMQLQIDNTREAIGFAVLPLITAFLPALQRLAEFGQENAEIIAKVGMVVGAFAGAIVAANVIMKAFRTTMLVVKAATLLFNIVLAANPIVLITLAVIALIAIFVALEKRFGIVSKAMEALRAVFDGAVRLMRRGFEQVTNVVRSFGRFLERYGKILFQLLTWPYQLLVRAVRGDLGSIRQFFRDLQTRAVAIIKAMISSVVNFFRDLQKRAVAIIKAMISSFVNFFKALPGRIRGFILAIRDNIRDRFTQARDMMRTRITQARDTIRARIQNVVDFVRNLPGRIANALIRVRDMLRNRFTQARDTIRARVTSVVDYVKGIPRRVAAFANTIRDAVTAPVIAARDRIRDAITSVVTTFSGLGSRITNATHGAFNGIWQAFGSAINRIIGAWNGLTFRIGGFSAFGATFPSVTISTPNIPTIRLAEGGIVTRPIQALIGERGPEAVIPLDQLAGFGGGGGIVINVTGSVITEGDLIETVRRGLVQSQRSGRRLTI